MSIEKSFAMFSLFGLCTILIFLFVSRYPNWSRPPQLSDYFSKSENLYEKIRLVRGEERDVRREKRRIRRELAKAEHDSPLLLQYIKTMNSNRNKKFLEMGSDGKNHALLELETLRLEIADIKQRETSSERFVSGAVAASAVLIFSNQLIGNPSEEFFLATIMLLFCFFGFWRFREYQRNNFEIDCYLRELEHCFRKDGGWVNFFFERRSPTKYFASRTWFWMLLIITTYGLWIYTISKIINVNLDSHVKNILIYFFDWVSNATR